MPKTSGEFKAVILAVSELPEIVGKELGPTGWVIVDQSMVDRFAEISGDVHWIHTDPDRARKELPGGKPIVHGYLMLSLLTNLVGQLLKVEFSRALNYGLDRVRFLAPVPSGARLRLTAAAANAAPISDQGMKLELDCSLELHGAIRPALVARTISIYYP